MSRILVVDDEPAIRAMLGGLLAREGRELVLAADGSEALRLAGEGTPFDVALVDKNLPDRTGIEVGRELRVRCPETEILLMTGYPSFDSAVEALRLGACEYLSKPIFDFDELEAKIARACERARSRREQHDLARRLCDSEQRLETLRHTAGLMCHDFNNLLTVILVNGEVLLAKMGDDERRARQVRGILDAGGQSAELVRQLMRLAPKPARSEGKQVGPG